MAMGLRLLSVQRSKYAQRSEGRQPEDEFPELLDSLEARGLIERDASEIRLTELGGIFGYDVAKEFYSDFVRAKGQKLAESLARKRDVQPNETGKEDAQ